MINLKISPQAKRVHLPEVVGKGYGTFWNFKGRYRVCKGSRASKKSKTTALNIIKRMMQYPEANTLVVRKVFRTLKDSCFTELKWAINRLGVSAYWEIKESPLEMTYLPTGQKIYFRGLDDPLKVTSITVEIGYLCWCWIEEAYEIMNESDFDMLDESIRGASQVVKTPPFHGGNAGSIPARATMLPCWTWLKMLAGPSALMGKSYLLKWME